MVKFQISAFADEYADDIHEQCAALKSFDIRYIEIRGVNGKNISTLSESEVISLKAILEDYGIGISSIGSPIGKVSLDDDLTLHFESAKSLFDKARILGAKNVRIFSFYPSKNSSDIENKHRVFSELEKLFEIAEQYSLTLCHENEALIYGESPENCLEISDYFEGKIKCVFDMGNFVLSGYDPMSAFHFLKSHIAYFHIKDALQAGAVVPPGKGEAKIKEILSEYAANNTSNVFVTLEPHLQTFSGFNTLVGKTFDNPYKYKNRREAFADAVKNLRGILL